MFPSEERHGQWLGGAGELIPAAPAAPQGDRFTGVRPAGDRGRLGSGRTLRALKSRQRSGGRFQGRLLSRRAWSDAGVS